MRYTHIIRYVMEQPWAILPATLAAIVDLLRSRAEGDMPTPEEVLARVGAAPARTPVQGGGGVAVIPVYGVINQRMNLLSAMFGGTSTELLAAQFRQAMADPGVRAIVLDVDSPGGGVYGVDELAGEIFRARGEKPVVAVANSLMASAAYWIGSAADEIVVTPSGEVGSIGVLAAHEDLSAALEQVGRRVTLISAGKYKTEGNPFGPLDDEARAYIQSRVNDYYSLFVNAVARGRGVTPAQVRNGFGEGRVVGAREAVRLGMADRIGTLDSVVQRLLGGRAPAATRAESETAAPLVDVLDEDAATDTEAGAGTDIVAASTETAERGAAPAADLEVWRWRLRLLGAQQGRS